MRTRTKVLTWILFFVQQRVIARLKFRTRRESIDVLFVANGVHFQEFTELGSIAWPNYPWHARALQLGFKVKACLHPFSSSTSRSTMYEVLRIEGYSSIYSLTKQLILSLRRESFPDFKNKVLLNMTEIIWHSFLLNSKPRIIFAINSGDVLTSICNELKIKLVEVQHGWLSPIEIDLLQGGPSSQIVWTANEARQLALKGYNSLALGHPLARTIDPRSNSQCDILVALTYHLKNSWNGLGVMSELFFLTLTGLLDKGYRILVRPHPMSTLEYSYGERNNSFKFIRAEIDSAFKNSDLRVVHPQESSLFTLINSTRLVVSEKVSSIFWDSFECGVPVATEQSEMIAFTKIEGKYSKCIYSLEEILTRDNLDFLPTGNLVPKLGLNIEAFDTLLATKCTQN